MNFPDDDSFETNEHIKKLGSAKKRILELLWSGDWVEGAKISRDIDQTEYDRRIRELRFNDGWQIAWKGKKYKLISRIKLPAKAKRKYPTKKQKTIIFERDKGRCVICGALDENIQFDHKVPYDRGGLTEIEHLQLLCSPCNVAKRGVCKGCTLETCDGCPYAYPELFAARLVVSLDGETAAKLQAESEKTGVPHTVLVQRIISEHFKKS